VTLSDRIAAEILRMLELSDGIMEIQRNSLASMMGCVPSQINYVITSRFTPEHGFLVESRRGGGGYIKITRINSPHIGMHIVNSIGDSLDMQSLRAILESLAGFGIVDPPKARMILSAVSDRALQPLDPMMRDTLRASIFKQILLAVLDSNEDSNREQRFEKG